MSVRIRFIYEDVEAILAEVMQITDENRAAFHARIRHLRNIGVANIPRPGKGSKIRYSSEGILQLYVALRLQEMGFSPSAAKRIIDEPEAAVSKAAFITFKIDFEAARQEVFGRAMGLT